MKKRITTATDNKVTTKSHFDNYSVCLGPRDIWAFSLYVIVLFISLYESGLFVAVLSGFLNISYAVRSIIDIEIQRKKHVKILNRSTEINWIISIFFLILFALFIKDYNHISLHINSIIYVILLPIFQARRYIGANRNAR